MFIVHLLCVRVYTHTSNFVSLVDTVDTNFSSVFCFMFQISLLAPFLAPVRLSIGLSGRTFFCAKRAQKTPISLFLRSSLPSPPPLPPEFYEESTTSGRKSDTVFLFSVYFATLSLSLSLFLCFFLSFFLSSFSSNVIFSSSVIFNRAPPPRCVTIVVFAGRGSLFFKGLSKDAG